MSAVASLTPCPCPPLQAALHQAEKDLAQRGQENQALQARVSELEQKLHDSEMERRQLHNMVQELKVRCPVGGGSLRGPEGRWGRSGVAEPLMGPLLLSPRATSGSSAACAPCSAGRRRPRRR